MRAGSAPAGCEQCCGLASKRPWTAPPEQPARGLDSASLVTLLCEPTARRYSARTSPPAPQPSCGYKLTPCCNFSISKQLSWNFRCMFASLDDQHKFCIRTSGNLLPQPAGIASPVSRPAMSLRDSRAACTKRWAERPSPSARLGGPVCLSGPASAWTYASRPCDAREPGCRGYSWPRKHESITMVMSVQ
jgi:hypothetical protein